MWGELLVLLAGAGAAAAVNLLKVEGLVVWVWHTSLHSVQQQASVVQVDQLPQLLRAVELAGVQLASDMPLEQQLEEKLSELQMTACQDSWYRSCVELIVPSLLHMRAAGTLDDACFAASTKLWFGQLEVMLDARIYAVANGKSLGKVSEFSKACNLMTCQNRCTMPQAATLRDWPWGAVAPAAAFPFMALQVWSRFDF
jgi:hypothetical protein